ncbi:MAG: DUF1385 domain-containing protein [Ignavibacteriae bacterium]|nr:DUF1385 domain-containing protein [Ignavibacteriota bacterium]
MAVGGQAVLEGVMMRAPGMVATAVRKASGEIVVKKEPHVSLAERYPIFKSPILRGAVGLIEMMVIGIRTLNFSAEVALDESDNRNGNGAAKKSSSSENLKLAATVIFALTVGITVFFVTPLAVTTFFFDVEQKPLWFNLIAGGIRIGLLLLYLLAISLLKDIKRLFQYHGAEHKAVFAFEKGEALDVASASRQSRFHPRCGTSFLLIVMAVAIVLFSLLDVFLIQWLGHISVVTRIATHLPLIPFVGGVSYEFIRASAKRSETPLGRLLVAPGLWLQKITTKEPDESQLEVAVAALRCALGEEYLAPAIVSVPNPVSVN